MRSFAWGCVLVVLVAAWCAAVPASAQPVQGRGVGVDAFYASAGAWDAFHLQHEGGAASILLSWSRGVLISVDYDLTLYRPGALDDGSLTMDEVVARSWEYRSHPTEERIEVADLPAGRYVVTVEPIRAQGESYELDANGRLSYAAFAPGVKLFL